jgi:hypothetical protein
VYFVNGDTLLNGLLFVKFYEIGVAFQEGTAANGTGNGVFSETPFYNPSPIAFMRSLNGAVYKWNSELSEEELLYNFDGTVGDYFMISTSIVSEPLLITDISTITIGGIQRRVISRTNVDGFEVFPKIIEGVGTPFGPWHSGQIQLDFTVTFQCFSMNGSFYTVNSSQSNWLDNSSLICEFAVGLKEESISKITLFPSPAKEKVMIQFDGIHLPSSIQIFNSVGQLVHTDAVNGRQQLTLNTESLATGVYIVRAADSSLTATFVKE